MFERLANRGAFWTLLVARVVYALNWYNIASVFSFMAVDFGQGISGLGTLTSSFYLGIGLLQIPGAIVAVKLGPKLTATLGTLIMSMAVLVSGLSNTFALEILARFLVGTGMALIFAPAVVLITQYFRRGAEGLAVGLYSSAYQIGGMLGVFGWAVVASTLGWRPSLLLSGTLGLATVAMIFLLVPRDSVLSRLRIGGPELRRVLLDRNLLALGVVATGVTVGSILLSSFLVYYLEKSLGDAPAIAGALSALTFVVPIFSSPFGGRIYDRSRRFRSLFVASGSVSAVATVITGFGGVYGPIIACVLAGFVSGLGFTVVMSLARESRALGPEFRILSIAWVNSVSLTTSFIPPIVFSTIAGADGYTAAWIGGGVLAFVLMLPALLIKATR